MNLLKYLLIIFITISPFSSSAELCDDLFINSSINSIWVPSINGFNLLDIQDIGSTGKLATLRYVKPSSMSLGEEFMLGSGDYAYGAFPFFNQFGLAYQGSPASTLFFDNTPVFVRVPNVAFVNSVRDELIEKSAYSAPEFSFIALDYIPKSTIEISNYFAKKQIVIFELNSQQHKEFKFGDTSPYYFFHDRFVHMTFWLVTSKEIADAIASRHQFLGELLVALGDSEGSEIVKQVMNLENQLADFYSASFNFHFASNSLEKEIKEASGNENKLLSMDDFREPGVTMLQTLYLLTRSSKSLMKYKDSGKITIKTYRDAISRYKPHEIDISWGLTDEQKRKIHELWKKHQETPELKMSEMDKVREAILERLQAKPLREIPFLVPEPSRNI